MSLITYVTRIHFADRILEDALAEELARCKSRRPLIVTETDHCGDGAIERLWDALPVTAEPVRYAAPGTRLAAADLPAAQGTHRASGCDVVIGFGGARPLDLARLLGTTLGAAVIAVPTRTESVGLGSLGVPFARWPARQDLGIGGGGRGGPAREGSVPTAILCDATLTLGADARTTAEAGMVALVQCLEAYLGTAFNPPADGIALEGLRRAARYLEQAVADRQDLEARRELLAAALNAGLAAQKGLGGVEAMARALAAEAEPCMRHGACHAALLPEVLAFNAPAIADRFAAIAAAMGLPVGADPVEALVDLARRLGLPARLSALGVAAAMLEPAALGAAADVANRSNPRHATAEDYHTMMLAVL
jgi:4-hydroxybutyrate dehydrogenase